MTSSGMIAAVLAQIIGVAVILRATEAPRPHWSQEASKGKPQLTITVTTAELASEQSLVKATCEIAFFDRDGKKLRTERFDVDVPIAARSKKVQEFSYDPPPAAATKGIKMDYRIATRLYATNEPPAPSIVTFMDGSVPPSEDAP